MVFSIVYYIYLFCTYCILSYVSINQQFNHDKDCHISLAGLLPNQIVTTSLAVTLVNRPSTGVITMTRRVSSSHYGVQALASVPTFLSTSAQAFFFMPRAVDDPEPVIKVCTPFSVTLSCPALWVCTMTQACRKHANGFIDMLLCTCRRFKIYPIKVTPLLQALLQDVCWSECDRLQKRQLRLAAMAQHAQIDDLVSEPLFCVETALKVDSFARKLLQWEGGGGGGASFITEKIVDQFIHFANVWQDAALRGFTVCLL